MTSTAIPAYLLAREVTSWRPGAWIAAALSVLVPWMAQSMSVMTEVVAYPVFAWAAYAMTRAIARPSLRGDVLALVAVGVGVLARTQFVVLALALPVAAVLHEALLRYPDSGGWRRAPATLWAGIRAAAAAHRLIVVCAVVGLLLVAVGGADVLLGNYSTTVEKGSVLPAGIVGAAFDHIAFVAVGLGVLPLLFAIAFALSTLGRRVDAHAHALAAVFVVVVPALTLAVASFDQRFNAGSAQERYLFYLCPLIMAAAVGWFARGAPGRVATGLAAVITTGIVLSEHYEPQPFASFASPNRHMFSLFEGRAYQVTSKIGLGDVGPTPFIVIASLAGAAIAYVLLRRGRDRLALGAFGAVIGVFLAAQLVYVMPRVAILHNSVAADLFGARSNAERDWIDRTGGGDVAAVQGVLNSRDGQPYFNTFADGATWWDVEFWNKDVDRVFGLRDRDDLTLGPVQPITLDFASGAMGTTSAERPSRLVVATSDVRFAPESRGTPLRRGDMTLYDTPRPYRADWATRGLDDYGWTPPGAGAALRIYARRDAPAEMRSMRVLLTRPDPEKPAPRYSIEGGGVSRSGSLRRDADVRFDVCVPAGGHTDMTLNADRRTRLGEDRFVGYRVFLISSRSTGRPCRR